VVYHGEPQQVPPSLIREAARRPHAQLDRAPTSSEVVESKVLLAEICSLKDKGLTAKAVVTDFVFKNIQPLKYRVYPAYLYTGVNDPTRITNRQIPNEDLLSWIDLMLRGRVSNAGASLSYSAWNLPPQSPFSDFVSNPPVRDGSPGHRMRPSSEDIEAFIVPFQNLPKAERQTHFEMPTCTDDAEMNVVLSMLTRESSDSAHTEPMEIAIGQNLGEDEEIRKPEGARRKRSCLANHPVVPDKERKKKRRLRRLSFLEQDVAPPHYSLAMAR
jgi:hypothetical protein